MPSVQAGSPSPTRQLHAIYRQPLPANAHYNLPLDLEEHHRLDIQHEMQKRAAGGLYPVPDVVRDVLTPKNGLVPRVLDVGTGSGAWALDMAREFPQCEVIGIDLVPPTSRPSHPPNLRFEMCDINLPLPMETASVDFVHARLVDLGITDYRRWFSEVARVLRPNAAFIIITAHFQLVNEDGTDLPTVDVGKPGYTGLQNIFSANIKVALSRRGGIYPYDHWITWMKETGSFEKMTRNEDTLLPFGPWQTGPDENARVVGELMRRNILQLVVSFKPMILSGGYEETLVNKWIEDAMLELSEQRVKVYSRWSSAWCIRSTKEWRPDEAKITP